MLSKKIKGQFIYFSSVIIWLKRLQTLLYAKLGIKCHSFADL